LKKAKYKTAALQNGNEIASFIELLAHENVRSYLEIGSKFGGSLWRVAWSMPRGSRVVSIDQPHGDGSFKETQAPLEACVARLAEKGYDAHLFLGDSTSPEAIAFATRLGPFDAVFIDANHTEPYVRADWANYGPLGRLVAFHDIGWVEPANFPAHKLKIDVPKVWDELREGRKHLEIRRETGHNGIGVLWRS
jgi:predicted O-methyltransferase YrrM